MERLKNEALANVRKAEDAANAKAGGLTGLKTLTAGATGSNHTLSHGPLPIPLLQTDTKIDPTTPVRLLEMSDGHLHTGDSVKYENGGGASMYCSSAVMFWLTS